MYNEKEVDFEFVFFDDILGDMLFYFMEDG